MANKKAEILTMDGQVVSPITLATNVLLDDGRTAQDLLDSRDESMFSPTITTSSSISKVGQGDNVDFSENIIDGAYKSCVLKGKTLVNHNAEGNNRNEYACMPSLEGSNLTVNGTVEGKVKSAILKGQTVSNLWKELSNVIAVQERQEGTTIQYDYSEQYAKVTFGEKQVNAATTVGMNTTQQLQGNKTYYINTFVLDGSKTTDRFLIRDGFNNVNLQTTLIKEYPTGQILSFTTEAPTSRLLFYYFAYTRKYGAVNYGKPFYMPKRFIISDKLEDVVNQEFFEGMQSVKMPVLTTTGKNLFDGELVKNKYYNGSTGELVAGNNNLASVNPIRVNPNTSIVLSTSANLVNNNHYICEYASDGTFIKRTNSSKITTSETTYFIKFHFAYETINESPNVQLEEGSTATSYEPYKSNILTTTSKNLFDMNRPYDNLTDSQASVVQDTNQITVSSSAESGIYVNANFILDKDFFAGKTVTGSCLYESDENDIGTVQIAYQDGNGEHHYQWIKTPKTFTFPNSFIGDVMLSVSANNTGTPQSNTVTVKNIQLELGSTATPYEPYSEVTLRGIGEVKDELNVLTSEVVERTGEIVLDGSENWRTNKETETHASYYLNIESNMKPLFKAMTNSLTTYEWGDVEELTKECFWSFTSSYGIIVSKVECPTIEDFKQKLSNNPVLLQYELNESTIKTVDLSDNVVYSYKDTTHYACSSEEGSLVPTLSIEEGVKYKAIIKPSTKYSIVFNHTEVASGLTVDLGGATTSVTSSTLGKNIVQITTTSTLSHNYVIFKGLGNVIKDVQVIEGEVVGDEPYFEGMCDVEMPVVKNVGKNLFDGGISNHYWNAPFTNGAQDISMQRADNCASTSRIRVRKGETYHLSGVNLIRNVATFFKTKDSQEKPFHGLSANSFTSPYDGYIEWYISNDNINNPVKNVQIEAGSTTTPYEDYKSNILHTPEEVVLRSLPNGAKDTLNLNTGEYVQRIKEVTFDGSNDEGWVVASQTNSTTQCFDVLVAGASSNNDGYIATFCDKFPSYTASHLWYYEKEGVGNPSSRIRLRLNATRLSTVDVAGLRTYLQSNPITVQYELATPIITTIDLKQHLFAYKDGYVVLTSSSEEISLTPTIEYSLIANRLGQIQSNQKLVEKQQAQINELESIVITNLVNTQYQQALNEIKLGVK